MRARNILVLLLLSACLPSAFDRVDPVQRENDASLVKDAGASGADPGAGTGRSGSAAGEDRRAAGSSGASARAGAGREAGRDALSASGTTGGAGRGASDAGPVDAAPPPDAQAGDAGMPSPCGDTLSDSKNCGQCGHDCSANSAQVMCVSSMCVRACMSDYADCNGDLSFGPTGDGCETHVVDDAKNCGGCAIRCDRPLGGIAACDARSCMAYLMHVGQPDPGTNALHGSPHGGQPYSLSCGMDETLVGIDAVSDAITVFGFAARCARLSLTGAAAKLGVSVAAPHASALLGNNVMGTPPVATLDCPSGSIVTAIAGATWYYPTSTSTSTELSIKQLSLTCSRVSIDAQRRVVFAPAGTLNVGSPDAAVETFADACRAGASVAGLAGRYGAYIDAVQMLCAPVLVSYEASGNTGAGLDEAG